MRQSLVPELPLRQLRDQLLRANQTWLRILVPIAVLLISFGSTYFFAARTTLLLLIIGGTLGVTGVLILLRWPPLGLVLLAFTGMFTPRLPLNNLNTSMLLVVLLLGLWLLKMLAEQKRIALVRSRTFRPLILLVITSSIAFAIGQFRWFSGAGSAPLVAQLGGFSLVVLSAGAFLLAAHNFTDIRWLKATTWAFLIGGAVYLLARLIPALRPLLLNTILKNGAFDALFWAWFPALAVSQALLNRSLRPATRVILLIFVAILLYVSLTQSLKWKSGWLPAAVAIVAVVSFRSWRAGLLLLLAGGIPVLAFADTIFETEVYSIATRLDAWAILFEIIRVSPVLGLGFGNYRFYTPLFRIRGWSVEFNSHNNYLDLLAQIGVVGLVCFLWFFAEVGLLGWRLRQRVPEGFARAYVVAALAGTAGTLVAGMLGDWIIPFVYNITIDGFRTSVVGWLFLGGLVALEKLYTHDAHSERT